MLMVPAPASGLQQRWCSSAPACRCRQRLAQAWRPAPPLAAAQVMLTFLEFYECMLQFVNFKLYHSLGVSWG